MLKRETRSTCVHTIYQTALMMVFWELDLCVLQEVEYYFHSTSIKIDCWSLIPILKAIHKHASNVGVCYIYTYFYFDNVIHHIWWDVLASVDTVWYLRHNSGIWKDNIWHQKTVFYRFHSDYYLKNEIMFLKQPFNMK